MNNTALLLLGISTGTTALSAAAGGSKPTPANAGGAVPDHAPPSPHENFLDDILSDNEGNAGFIEGSLGLEELRELKNPLVIKKVDLEAKIASLAKGKSNRLEQLRDWIISANAIGNAALQEDWAEMKKILQKAGSNPILRAQTLHVSFLKPWNLLAEINSATTTLSPVSGENENWWR